MVKKRSQCRPRNRGWGMGGVRQQLRGLEGPFSPFSVLFGVRRGLIMLTHAYTLPGSKQSSHCNQSLGKLAFCRGLHVFCPVRQRKLSNPGCSLFILCFQEAWNQIQFPSMSGIILYHFLHLLSVLFYI